MSNFLHWFVAIISVGSFLGCVVLIWKTSRPRQGESAVGSTTGHKWDDDLEEYNNPMPRWWLYLFFITIIFGLAYMYYYPGLGNFEGSGKWSQEGQYKAEMAAAGEKYGKVFSQYAKTPVAALASNEKAMQSGKRLFLNHCATCHGSDAGGSTGFPSLKDNAWLYGNSPEAIRTSITNGRKGSMPALGAALGGAKGAEEMAHYVKSLSGGKHDAAMAATGKTKFGMCMGCHGANGKGNQALGAPDLTDNAWLYGGSINAIKTSIMNGRNGDMPAHADKLSKDKIHVLTAYILSLGK